MLPIFEPFRPPAESQFQPLIPTSSKNCVANTTRKLIRRATCDRKAPSTQAIRTASGAPSIRGLSYGEAADAAKAVSGVILTPSYGNTRDEVFTLADAGHAFGISIDCSVTVHTARATGTYTGDHTVYVQDARHVAAGGSCLCEKRSALKAHNEFLIEDPGNSSKGYQWWSASLVYAAAEARTTDHLGVTHGINLLVAPDTEGVTRKVIGVGQIRSQPDVNSPSLRRIPAKGTTMKVVRTATGGAWTSDVDGHLATGWHQVELIGPDGWVRGEALA